jgi:hypothetical protein
MVGLPGMSAENFACTRNRVHDGELYECGRVVLNRDPTTKEACPSYGGAGLFICADCTDDVCGFFDKAYNARARRMEHRAD